MTQSDLEEFVKNMKDNTNDDDDWELRSVGDICELNPGSINDSDFDYDTIQYVEISNTGDGYIDGVEEYKLENAPSRAKRTVSDGDSVISTVRPSRNHYIFIEDPPENLVVSTGFAVLHPKNPNQVLPAYLYFVVSHPVFIDYLDANATGSAYPAVNLDIIKRGKIPVPPTNKQENIVKKVKIFDDKIKNNLEEIRKLRELRDILVPEVLPPEKME